MTLLSLLINAGFAASEIVNVTVFCVALVAFRRTHISAFAFLVLASFLGIILETGAELGRYSLAWFWFPHSVGFHVGYLVGMIFWGIGIVLLTLRVWRAFEQKSPPNKSLQPTATAPSASGEPGNPKADTASTSPSGGCG